MKRRVVAIVVGLAAVVAPAVAITACGSRTGLLVPDEAPVVEPDGATIYIPITPPPTEDAFAPPPLEDSALPTIDVNVPDVPIIPFCADASDTLVYVVTEANTLLRFNPPSGEFTVIGSINCPDPFGRSPFSMAVDRFGVAYVLYAQYQDTNPGSLFRVSLATASCDATSYVGGQSGFNSFGMAFSADADGNGETLYVASDGIDDGALGAIDETTLTLTPVGSFSPAIVGAELSGTSDGRLFAFFAPGGADTQGTAVAQIDKTTAQVTGENFLPTVNEGDAWAFAFWGGNFYLFTASDNATSIVTRYNPSDGSLVQVASWPDRIVGAGVSTCAPAR